MELTGIGVGSQAVVGDVFLLETSDAVFEHRKTTHSPDEEASILSTAIATTAATIREESSGGDTTTQEILDALLIILEDPELQEMARPHLDEGMDAPTGLFIALDEFAALMGDDEDFQSRVSDLRGIAARISAWTRGIAAGPEIPREGTWIIVAEDLTPLETSQFGESVVGVITELGGPTSHTAIICRALGIPAVVSVKGAMELSQGASVLVDPEGNRVVPGGDLGAATTAISFIPQADSPLITVRANIGSVADAEKASSTSARGVGLFRTEVLYLSANTMPSVDDQAALYTEVLRSAPAGKIIIRTIDAGSDKPVPFFSLEDEENPALGMRGFRLATDYPEFQKSQLQAIQKAIAATGRDVGVMAPMVSTVEEVREFKALCSEAGISQVGIMIETPAIIPVMPDLGGVLDFVSIGTNDLSQYLFAADRMHPKLGSLNNPWQPGLLRSVSAIATEAGKLGIPVGVCGESAANPLISIVFAGLGIDSVSVAPSAVEEVSSALAAVTIDQAQAAADAAIAASTPGEAEAGVRALFA
ncbi:MAG: phosphoenolpyruvate--protein phosphotransferase [Microbacteriaceae bacterium]|jgi:phosphoenolpyruvate-protein phosphotransferase (PTS system enzyme I)|nr:phosphoenolpyruvate--protein phosphotransferase [Microbacteriaceae bacterium]